MTGLQSQEMEEHLMNCRTCSELAGKIRSTMEILDEKVELPSRLTESTLNKIRELKDQRIPASFDFSKYLQMAAVISVGIFLGILLGSRAHPQFFLSKKERKERNLMEYREHHHLNNQSSITRLI